MYTYTEDQVITNTDGTKSTSKTTVTVPDAAEQAMQNETIAAMIAANEVTLPKFQVAITQAMEQSLAQGLTYIVPPQALLPGDHGFAAMPDGSMLSLGPNGEIYLDARRLGIKGATSMIYAAAAKLVRVGISIYALGATDGFWYQWTNLGWQKLDQFDATVL